MILKIKVDDLKPGMHITDLGLSPIEYPHVFHAEGVIRTVEQIAAIKQKGYTEAFVDDKKSLISIDASTGWADLLETVQTMTQPGALASAQPSAPLPGPEEVHEKMGKAIKLYTEAFKTTEYLFTTVGKGKPVPIQAAYDAAGNVVDSIINDDLTLATITKLQSYDDYTFSHCVNVSVLATLFGRHLGLDTEWLNNLAMAGMLHDIGKTVIPLKLLNTARSLKEDEFEIMKGHALAGFEVLQESQGVPKTVKLGILEHHERHNGSGYPYGKQDDEISVMGQMLSIVDVYDALTSKRVYKPPLMPYTAVSFIYSQRGQHFEPIMVDRFIQSIGVYPAGSVVSLNTGEIGIVYECHTQAPLRPMVAIIMDKNGGKIPLKMINLDTPNAPSIVECLEAYKTGINVQAVLKACVWANRKI